MNIQPGSPLFISVIIPAHNSQSVLDACLQAVLSSEYPHYECILVDDCSKDGTPEKAEAYGVQVIRLVHGPFGPAYARNRGAEAARGPILFFIDSDVIIKPNTLSKVVETFENHSDISALFGSYDEQPSSKEFLSQYKNLLHHYVHQIGQEEASTFWSGCGAVKKQVFETVGGFDEKRYPKPSIEDIELGYRLRAAGHKIYLRKDIQVTHLKRWSLWGMIKTDIWYRAVPWTLLILKHRNLPNDLNLQTSQRLSTIFLLLLLVHQGIFTFQTPTFLLPTLIGLYLMIAHSWHWSEGSPTFRPSQKSEKTAYLLITVISLLALFLKLPQLLIPFIFLVPLFIAGTYLSTPRLGYNHLLFVSMMGLLAAEFVLTYASYPILFSLPQLIIVLAIILLNFRLYWFFVQKRGMIFALSALPLQLLYYFYSMVALLIGSIIYYWNLSPAQSKNSR
jgi:glycosyltransferase involved in cell wall biosynthesis